MYENFKHLHTAIIILSNDVLEKSKENINYAESLLIKFTIDKLIDCELA